ncbi:MAG TPA: hypothetical protein VHP31_00085 [Caproicibacter sp.]|nr:hypothetical protein [Caproicibacter sp.]
MENCWLNNEEKAIMDDLKGLPEPEIIEILKESLAGEADSSGGRVLRALLSKLEAGRGPASG